MALVVLDGWGSYEVSTPLCLDLLIGLNTEALHNSGFYPFTCSTPSIHAGDWVLFYDVNEFVLSKVQIVSVGPFTNSESDDMVVNCNVSPCVVTHALQTPFSFTVADGGVLATAILLVWVVGWGIRQVIRAMRVDESPPSE